MKNKTILWLALLTCLLLGIAETSAQTAQTNNSVSGTVSDAMGPLAGVNVLEKGTTNGTTTDFDGKYSLEVKNGSTLVFSYVGFITQEIVYDGQMPLNISLNEDSELLGEVVVVGYGVQKKANLSGSVDQINAKELEQKPITDISRGLQGMIPNLNIDFTSGEPGKAAEINIRGLASINGSAPLVLIDGVPSSSLDLNRLLPSDIESISVIKDASSAAIYGARAAFGVILITTKKGESGAPRVEYSGKLTWKRPTVLPRKTSDPYIYLKLKNIAVLNTPWSGGHVASDERLEWARQRSDNPALPPVRLNPNDETQYEYMGDKDWTDYFINKFTFAQSHQASISGGSDSYRYYTSVGYDRDNGILSHIVDKDYWERFNMRLRASYDLTKWFNISNNTTYSLTRREKPSAFWDSNMSMIYNLAPQDYDLNPDGTWANNAAGRVMAQLHDGGEDIRKNSRFQTNFGAKMSFWDNLLTLNASWNYTKEMEEYNYYQTKYMIGFGPEDIREEGQSSAYRTFTGTEYQVLDLFANLDWSIGSHTVTAILGMNQESSVWDLVRAEREGLISPNFPTIALATGEAKVGEQFADWAINGYFYRLNYTYDNKYIVELNGRYDGSSRFPEHRRYGFFPSFSAAWRVDREPFFQPIIEYVNHLKIRGSYGKLGNQNVTEYGYIPTMSTSQSDYIIGGTRPLVIHAPGLVSPNYSWEVVATTNFGMDLNFWQNRLSLVFDIYNRNTTGMLTKGKELPGVLGASVPNENAADMRTKGWELTLGYNDSYMVAGKPFNLAARFSLSDARSFITHFDNASKLLTQYYEGQEIGEIWGLESDGFFTSREEVANLDESSIIPWGALDIVPGWPKYIDQNGDKQITKGTTVDEPGDLKIIGNNSPRYRYGLNVSADWNGIDLSLFLQGVGKRDYYPLSYLYWSFFQQPYAGGALHTFDFYRPQTDSPGDQAKHSQSYLDAGLHLQNTEAFYPILQCWLADKNLGTTIDRNAGLAIPQTRYLMDGSYLRLKNITLGYTLPQSMTEKINISRVRFYLSGDNLYEWSALRKYFDPEAVTNETHFGYVYPFSRQVVFGLNVTF